MTDINALTGAGGALQPGPAKPGGGPEDASGFERMMQEAIGKLNQVQSDAENAVKELASGGDVTQAIIDMQKADMNFQMMVEVRNKLIAAYEEVMRMQV